MLLYLRKRIFHWEKQNKSDPQQHPFYTGYSFHWKPPFAGKSYARRRAIWTLPRLRNCSVYSQVHFTILLYRKSNRVLRGFRCFSSVLPRPRQRLCKFCCAGRILSMCAKKKRLHFQRRKRGAVFNAAGFFNCSSPDA